MNGTVSQKNPMFAGILSLFFGPLGYIYIGFNFLVAGVAIAVIIGIVISILHFPYPSFFKYLQMLVYAYFGYKFATISNVFAADESLSAKDVEEYKSMGFAFYMMTHVMMALVQFYAIVVALYFVYHSFAQGRIFVGILILFFGIGFVQYFLGFIFAMISFGIMKAFGVEKKYL